MRMGMFPFLCLDVQVERRDEKQRNLWFNYQGNPALYPTQNQKWGLNRMWDFLPPISLSRTSKQQNKWDFLPIFSFHCLRFLIQTRAIIYQNALFISHFVVLLTSS